MSIVPCELLGTSTGSRPQKAAVAGLVPCAESGISTFVRVSPRERWYAAIIMIPVNSPCRARRWLQRDMRHASDLDQLAFRGST